MENKPVILILEDNRLIQFTLAEVLSGHAEVLPAFTIGAAETFFLSHIEGEKPIALIVIDGSIYSKGKVDTAPLVREMRDNGFTGPMIAASATPGHNDILISAGCSHRIESKSDIPKLVLELLKK